MQNYAKCGSGRHFFKIFLIMALAGCFVLTSCKKTPTPLDVPTHDDITSSQNTTTNSDESTWPRPRSVERVAERNQMVEHIRRVYELEDPAVLEALKNVPRHWFVPQSRRSLAYSDTPLPIGYDQTISQPFIVAYMTSLLELTPDKKVLEVGTGSGYQAAVLAELTPHVYTIEIVEPLALATREKLKRLGYETIEVKIGDGYQGWQRHQPFDAMIVTCAPDHVPQPLLDQLRPGGRIVIPVGDTFRVQNLVLIRKDREGNIKSESLIPVRFVPMVREPVP